MTNDIPSRGSRWLRRLLRIGAAALLCVLLLGAWLKYTRPQGFMVDLKASQIGVRVDYLRGESSLIATPGYHFLVPWLQEIVLFDRSPVDIVLKPGESKSAVPAGPTTVRSKDGSKFWFEGLQVQYQLLPDQAGHVLASLGGGAQPLAELVQLAARAVLGQEFGRYAAHEIADPATTDAAKLESKRRLAELLKPYGIDVIQITMPKPRFEREYERAIDERKLAAQNVEQLQEKLGALREERGQKFEKLARAQDMELAVLNSYLREKTLEAESAESTLRSKADAYATGRRSAGEGRARELLAQAAGLQETTSKGAQGLLEQVRALETAGATAVREEIIKRLASIEFVLAPYREEPRGALRREGEYTAAAVQGGQ